MTECSAQSTNWETQILDLLNDLTSTQDELLGLLGRKRDVMARGSMTEMADMEPAEEELRSRLADCNTRRGDLLKTAASEGMPSESLEHLAKSLPARKLPELDEKIAESKSRIRLLQHESLANWVIAQRAVLHLSQILEILATGGKQKPTYENGESSNSRGNLVDQEA